ncbi:MAG: 23S rRNA (uridine(2479)-2'-O)-methyltransferase [Chlamydiae bacterium]|nr:23S rRNA (uridine(2479)-2'-O)-methyltransferase [Chlamydiota bacterium]
MKLTSMQNPQVKAAVKLQNRRERDETGLFLIEGYRELCRASDGGVTIQKVFFCPELFLGENEDSLIAEIESSGGAAFACAKAVFAKLSYRDRPDGLLGIGVQMKSSLGVLSTQLSQNPLLLIAEGIEKPGNLGSIMRSADGVGVDGVIVCDRCTDIYNPNVVRASVGTLFTLPIVEATGADTFLWLKEHKIQVLATSPSAELEFTEADLRGPVAIVVGTEQLGLTELWMNAADHKVSIPMKGVADSLNVATATTLLLYEVLRQRKIGYPLETDLLR